jgi:uncharacterized C2H2 Zn-finger protein
MSTHISINHLSVAKRCDYSMCSEYFITDEDKEKHQLEVHAHEVGKEKCEICGLMVLCLSQHISTIHFKRFDKVKCPFCPALINRSKLSSHVKKQHSVEHIKCNIRSCRTYFYSEEERNEHIQKVHVKKNKRRIDKKCVYCGMIFKSYGMHHYHVNKEHSNVKVQCKVNNCSIYFLTELERENHHREIHKQSGEKLTSASCLQCNFTCGNKARLRVHMKRRHRAVGYDYRRKIY